MGDLKEELIAKTMGTKDKPEQTIDEVEKEAGHMGVIDKTMETARKLAGTSTLSEELKRKDERMEKLEKVKDKVTDELREAQIQNIRTEFGSKIDHLAESIKAGASPKSIGDQIAEVKKVAGDLGLSTSKVSEFKEMANLIQALSPQQKGLAEQVKEAMELLHTLQPEKKEEDAPTGVPASVAIELKRMDTDLKLRVEQMQDDRQRKDQDFQLTLKKWEEDRELKRQEIEGKLTIERERNELLAGGLDRLGRVIAQATSEAPSRHQISPAIQARVGEFGEVTCPNCQATVPIARDAVRAVCPSCGTPYSVNRIKEESPAEQAEGVEQPGPVTEEA
jgi:rubrerythrin